MKQIQIKTHIGSDGILRLELPVGITDTDCDILVAIRPEKTVEDWLTFIERTAGSLADDPIERGDQGIVEIRDEMA